MKNFKKIGCYKEDYYSYELGDRILINERDMTHFSYESLLIGWRRWPQSLDRFVFVMIICYQIHHKKPRYDNRQAKLFLNNITIPFTILLVITSRLSNGFSGWSLMVNSIRQNIQTVLLTSGPNEMDPYSMYDLS